MLQGQLEENDILSRQEIEREDSTCGGPEFDGFEPPRYTVLEIHGQNARQAEASTGARMTPDRGYNLRLYVAGQTPKSIAAIANLKRICEQHLTGKYKIEIVDLMANPALAQRHQIVAIPTLIRQLPEPLKRIIGDLSNVEKVLVGLDIRPN